MTTLIFSHSVYLKRLSKFERLVSQLFSFYSDYITFFVGPGQLWRIRLYDLGDGSSMLKSEHFRSGPAVVVPPYLLYSNFVPR